MDIGLTYALEYNRQIEEMKVREPDLGKWLRGPKTTTQDDIANRRQRGTDQVLNYKTFAFNNEFVIADIDDYTLAIEVEFEVEIGGTLIKGAIDQVILHPTGYEVRDLKTGNREQGILQLGVYTVALEKIFGWPVIRGSYYYAKDNKVVTVSRTELNRYNETYLGEMFDAMNKGVSNNVFIPNPGGHCMLCPVKKSCREMGSDPKPLGSRE